MKIFTKKRALAAGAAVAILGGSMAAYAYFTGGSATDTKPANVGGTTTWSVALGTFSGGPMYPGSGTETASYTITNTGNGNQALTAVTAVVPNSGGDVTVGGTPVAGCLATWFTATAGAPTPGLNTAIAKTATATGSVTVVLNESNSLQNACKSVTPDVTINVA